MVLKESHRYFLKIAVFFFILFSSALLFSQNENSIFEIRGSVLYKNMGVENAHIINISNKKNTISNVNGEFSLEVSVNDTLEIRCLAFQFETLVISESTKNTKTLTVVLTKRINQLKEVTISSNKLSGDLEKDLQNIPYNVIDPSEKLGIEVFEGEPQEKIPTVMQSLNYGLITQVQLEPLYKHISGYYKRLKDKRKFNHGTKTVENILYFYGTSFFQNSYHIEPDQVYNFLFFCLETNDTLITTFENKNYSQLLEIFDEKALLFNR